MNLENASTPLIEILLKRQPVYIHHFHNDITKKTDCTCIFRLYYYIIKNRAGTNVYPLLYYIITKAAGTCVYPLHCHY